MDNSEKNKRKGLIASIGFHLVLVIIFAFFGMSYMVPPPEEEGITINFGTVDEGMMSPTPTPRTSPTEEQVETETEVVEPVPEEVLEEDIITQETEEAPSIDKKEEEKKPEEKVEEKKKEEPKPDKNLSSAISKWQNKKQEQSGGDGTSNKSGDQGDINGDPNSKNYQGGGAGNGPSFTLAGRSMVSSPPIKDNSQEEGTVVVDIIVDQYGRVIRANPGARGSTTTNSTLMRKAKEAALKTRFNPNPDAAEEQKGQMTFVFILN